MAEQGETYAAYIASTLSSEHARGKALSDRAAAVTTTSSAFLALVLTLTVLVTGDDRKFSATEMNWVSIGFVALAVASATGLYANFTRKYEVASMETMHDMISGHWTDDEVDARNAVAYLNYKTTDSLRGLNKIKSVALTVALSLQIVGVVAVLVGLVASLPAAAK